MEQNLEEQIKALVHKGTVSIDNKPEANPACFDRPLQVPKLVQALEVIVLSAWGAQPA